MPPPQLQPDQSLSGNSRRHISSMVKGQVWPMIFKDATWLEQVIELGAMPALFGYDLNAIRKNKKPEQAYLVLVISDWSGDVRYIKKQLFESLHEHEYDKKTFEVHLRSGIVLNVHEPVKCYEGIEVVDPEKLFHRKSVGLYSTVLYYNEPNDLREIGPDHIGGLERRTGDSQEVDQICSVKLKFADGKPVFRVIIKQGATLIAVPIRDKQDWIIGWRLPSLYGERDTAFSVAQFNVT